LGHLARRVGTLVSHSPWLDRACGMGGGCCAGREFTGFVVIRLRANQIGAGNGDQYAGHGADARSFAKFLYDVTGSTPSIPMYGTGFQIRAALSELGLVAICFLWMKYTPTGLWVNFAGEHPEALAAAGNPGQSRPLDGGVGELVRSREWAALRFPFFSRLLSRAI